MSNPITRRTLLAAATATVLALAIAPLGVCRADTLARVDVYDRNAGEVLPVYRHHGRRYVVGDRLTIAGLSLCGYLYWPEEIGIDWNVYPSLRDWLEREEGRF